MLSIREELKQAMLEYAQRKGLIPSEQLVESVHSIPEHDQPVPEKTSVSEVPPVPAKNQAGKQPA